MQEAGLQARLRKRYKVTTMSDHDQPVAANLLDRDFTAAAPNHGVGDTTEFVIGGSGKLYLAAILDLFSRFIVGWPSVQQRPPGDHQGAPEALKRRCSRRPSAPLRSGLHLCERGLSRRARHARYYVQHEPPRQLLRQRRDGELLLDGQERAPRALREQR